MTFIFVPMRLEKAKFVFRKLNAAYFQCKHYGNYTLNVNINITLLIIMYIQLYTVYIIVDH